MESSGSAQVPGAPSHAKQQLFCLSMPPVSEPGEMLPGVESALKMLIDQTAGCAANERWMAACLTARTMTAPLLQGQQPHLLTVASSSTSRSAASSSTLIKPIIGEKDTRTPALGGE